jgi:hypothetical protein
VFVLPCVRSLFLVLVPLKACCAGRVRVLPKRGEMDATSKSVQLRSVNDKIQLLLSELEAPPPVIGSEEERQKREHVIQTTQRALIELYRNEGSKHMVAGECELAVRWVIDFVVGEGGKVLGTYLLFLVVSQPLHNRHCSCRSRQRGSRCVLHSKFTAKVHWKWCPRIFSLQRLT